MLLYLCDYSQLLVIVMSVNFNDIIFMHNRIICHYTYFYLHLYCVFYFIFRFGSSSSQTSQTSGDICRICHCESDSQNPLLTPCYCSGSLKYVHQACLQQWLTASETNSCELCKFPFIMHTKIKPFNEVVIIL